MDGSRTESVGCNWEDVCGKCVLVTSYESQNSFANMGSAPAAVEYYVTEVKGDYVLLRKLTGANLDLLGWKHNKVIGNVIDIREKTDSIAYGDYNKRANPFHSYNTGIYNAPGIYTENERDGVDPTLVNMHGVTGITEAEMITHVEGTPAVPEEFVRYSFNTATTPNATISDESDSELYSHRAEALESYLNTEDVPSYRRFINR